MLALTCISPGEVVRANTHYKQQATCVWGWSLLLWLPWLLRGIFQRFFPGTHRSFAEVRSIRLLREF